MNTKETKSTAALVVAIVIVFALAIWSCADGRKLTRIEPIADAPAGLGAGDAVGHKVFDDLTDGGNR